ncbi:MAG: SWIM zinc finger family protein [Polyangiaceae bacterium]
MKQAFRYLGKSGVSQSASGASVHFSPNLAREKVFFDSELSYPLRFREAMSALHDVVIGDLRFEKKDKTAYEAFKAERLREEQEIRKKLTGEAEKRELAKVQNRPMPPGLQRDFQKMHRLYWDARIRWANELSRNDPELFRHLVPCDPVVTVAPDTVFFECFSKDESAYGCLLVDRNALKDRASGLGTTNVDYSIALYDHFQTLRTYRPTRLLVDPMGFEVSVEGNEDYREEKIDLPPSWLRGFGQLQATMTLPSRRVELPVETVYSILAYLKNHREKTGPRSLRFVLTPGKPPSIVLDPWGVTLESKGPAIDDGALLPGQGSSGAGPYRSAPARAAGQPSEEIKVWGRRRLFALARVLPLCDRVEVRLFGSGMPSVWIAHLGEMRFVLALSGWTANDWTSGGNLQLLRNVAVAEPRVTSAVAARLEEDRILHVGALATATSAPETSVLASLFQLSTEGQVVYDFVADRFRYRPILPVALSEAVLGPEHPELANGRRMAAENAVRVQREEALAGGRRLYVFKVQETSCEVVIDADLAFKKAKCTCSYFHKGGLRAGPCRHLIAFRLKVLTPGAVPEIKVEPAGPRIGGARASSGANLRPVPAQRAAPPAQKAAPSPFDRTGKVSPSALTPAPKASPAPQAPSGQAPSGQAPSQGKTGLPPPKQNVLPIMARTGPKREEVLSLLPEVAREMRAEASRGDGGLSEVVVQAWDAAFESLLSQSTWKGALALAAPDRIAGIEHKTVSRPEQTSLFLYVDVLREIDGVAKAFGASPSAVVNLAWLVARRRP